MNKTEQKERLKDIIDLAEEKIQSLEDKEVWLDITIQKAEDLSRHMSDVVDADIFEHEELIQAITNHMFEAELMELFELTDEFKDEIESYADGLSELKQERLLEKYEDLEIVCEKFNQSNSEYEDIENAIEHLEEAVYMLKEMSK